MTEKKLLDRVRDTLRRKNYAYRTEQAYVSWIKRYISYHNLKHPGDLSEGDIESFLTHLALQLEVSPSTQNQALAALKFLYLEVLHLSLDEDILPAPAKRSKHLPVVLSRQEVRALLSMLSGVHLPICQLLYGAGLRVSEALRLRIEDLDFDRAEITFRSGKGDKDRRTLLPLTVLPALKRHLEFVRLAHQAALAEGYGTVALPPRVGSKDSERGP